MFKVFYHTSPLFCGKCFAKGVVSLYLYNLIVVVSCPLNNITSHYSNFDFALEWSLACVNNSWSMREKKKKSKRTKWSEGFFILTLFLNPSKEQ